MGSEGDLDSQFSQVAAVEATCAPDSEAAATRFPALESLSKECEDKGVVDNHYTRHTVHSIKVNHATSLAQSQSRH